MAIVKLSEGAFFVPSYSTQTITPAYNTGTTLQALTPASDIVEDDEDADETQESLPVVCK